VVWAVALAPVFFLAAKYQQNGNDNDPEATVIAAKHIFSSPILFHFSLCPAQRESYMFFSFLPVFCRL